MEGPMSRLEKRFADGVKAPTGEALRLGEPEFIDTANSAFDFDGAAVLSSDLSLRQSLLEFRLDYIAAMGALGMRFRKLRLRFEGINTIEFGGEDGALGFPHRLVRKVDLEYAVRNHPEKLLDIERLLWGNYNGAELDCVSFEKRASLLDQVLGKKEPVQLATVWLEWSPPASWAPPRSPGTIVVDTLCCHDVIIEFLSPAARKSWSGRDFRLTVPR